MKLTYYSLFDFIQNSKIVKWIDFVEKSQWWSPTEIKSYQDEQLQKLINHCYYNVKFYNLKFKELNLKPNDIKTSHDLVKLPIISKEYVRSNFNQFVAKNLITYRPVFKHTGGSTGVPFNYYNDIDVWSLHWALKFRSWAWGGYRLGDKIAILGGGSLFLNEKKSFKRILWKKLNNFYQMPMTHSSKEQILKYAELVEKKNIEFIRGYPSSISFFAETLKERNIKLKVKSVFPTAEVLTPDYRNNIENGLTKNIFDQYGCADAGAHASECPAHMGLHVHPEVVITEVIGKESETLNIGYEGELVFTSLHNYSMPLLRYRPEDIAIQSKNNCSCGRHSLLLDQLIGRTTDIIRFDNGTVLAGPALTLIFSRINVLKYQVVQNSLNSLDLYLIKSPTFTKDDHVRIIDSFKMHCGQSVKININYVDKIELPESGKFRFVISKVKKD